MTGCPENTVAYKIDQEMRERKSQMRLEKIEKRDQEKVIGKWKIPEKINENREIEKGNDVRMHGERKCCQNTHMEEGNAVRIHVWRKEMLSEYMYEERK